MCDMPIELPHTHDACVLCLGFAYAEVALGDCDCHVSEDLPIKTLHTRLAVVLNSDPPAVAPPLPTTVKSWAGRPQQAQSGGSLDELTPAQHLCAYCPPEPLVSYTEDSLHPSPEVWDLVSFNSGEDDAMSINSSNPGTWSEAPMAGAISGTPWMRNCSVSSPRLSAIWTWSGQPRSSLGENG